MGRLVADLLDSSVIETGGLRLQPDWCDLELLTRQAVSLVPELHDVELELGWPLPAVWADHDRVEQVLVNVLDNAVHHGAEPVTVRVRADERHVTLDVLDSGVGFPAEAADRAFEPYVAGTHSRGAGIGLAIVRGMVEAHGGRVRIDRVGVPARTRVRITLPIEPRDGALRD
jgi:signal transduction histidine kinase